MNGEDFVMMCVAIAVVAVIICGFLYIAEHVSVSFH